MSERRTPSPRDYRRSENHSSERYSSNRHRSDRHYSDRQRRRSPDREREDRYSDRKRDDYYEDRRRDDGYNSRRKDDHYRGRKEDSSHHDRRRYQEDPSPVNGVPILPGESFSDYRTRARNESTITIWASSPERPRSPSPEEKKSRKEDSEEGSKRKHKKHHHSSRSHRKRPSKKRKRYSESEKSEQSEESEESEHEEVAIRTEKRQVVTEPIDNLEELWVEKQVDLPEDLAPVGPVPMIENDTHNERQYGSALLPGEGSAMAAYVQQGKRIPRRGEIGLSGEEISVFEKAGFVMSGSRHQRMNAVRLRKENQVISAEEKRLVLQHAQEQKLRRENEIISGFREILSDKFKKEDDN